MNQDISERRDDMRGTESIVTLRAKIHWHCYGVKSEQGKKRLISSCQQHAFQNTAFA